MYELIVSACLFVCEHSVYTSMTYFCVLSCNAFCVFTSEQWLCPVSAASIRFANAGLLKAAQKCSSELHCSPLECPPTRVCFCVDVTLYARACGAFVSILH